MLGNEDNTYGELKSCYSCMNPDKESINSQNGCQGMSEMYSIEHEFEFPTEKESMKSTKKQDGISSLCYRATCNSCVALNPLALMFILLLLCSTLSTSYVRASPPKPILRPEAAQQAETLCEQLSLECIHGVCKNDTEAGPVCDCLQGWNGPACDSCGGRIK